METFLNNLSEDVKFLENEIKEREEKIYLLGFELDREKQEVEVLKFNLDGKQAIINRATNVKEIQETKYR